MTQKDRLSEPMAERLVAVGEIATIAAVGPSAVSNWRKRHANFPLAVETKASGELFRLDQVIAWLKAEGKTVNLPDYSLAKQLERHIWNWSSSVRGILPTPEFVDLPLQLMFLRRECEKAGDKDSRPNWHNVVKASTPELETTLREALAKLSLRRPDVGMALEPAYSIGRVHPPALRALVELVESLDLDAAPIGEVVSELVEAFGRRIGKRTDFFTPSDLRDLMIEVLRPIEGRIYDPACGTALLLGAAWRARNSENVELYGQELNQSTWRIGALNLALNDAAFDLASPADTLLRDLHEGLKADRIALDPPFNTNLKGIQWLEHDDRWQFGRPGKSSDLAWAQHLVSHLAEGGVGAMTCSPAVLLNKDHDTGIRRRLVEADLIDAVIQLPEGTLPATSIPPAMLIFSKNKGTRAGRILFMDAKNLGQPQRGSITQLKPNEIERISSTIGAWRCGTFEAEPSFSGEATTLEISSNDFDLSPWKYAIDLEEPITIDGESITHRYVRLGKDLVVESKAASETLENLFEVSKSITRSDGISRWPIQNLGTLLLDAPSIGVQQTLKGPGDPLPFISTGLVSGGRPSLERAPTEVTKIASRDRFVKKGDLLLVSRGVDRSKPVGCAKIAFEERATFSKSLVRLRVNPDWILAEYLRLFLTSRQGHMSLSALATGSVITNLPKRALLRVPVPLPDLACQHRIAEAMLEVERALDAVTELSESIGQQHDVLREGLIAGVLKAER